MPSRAIWARHTLCSKRHVSQPRGLPLRTQWGGFAINIRGDSSRPKLKPKSVTVTALNASFHSQPEQRQEAAASSSSPPQSPWLETPWLENRQLAHPKFTSHGGSRDNICIGASWFSGGSESFVSLFLILAPERALSEVDPEN